MRERERERVEEIVCVCVFWEGETRRERIDEEAGSNMSEINSQPVD